VIRQEEIKVIRVVMKMNVEGKMSKKKTKNKIAGYD
jgi:hypothetical protein